jgi:spermidine synthase
MLQDGGQYDYILVDGFDKNGKAGVLDTEPFYQACRARLADRGLLSVNLLGRSRGFAASKNRIACAFDDQAFIFPSCDSGNAIAFARGDDPVETTIDDLLARADALRTETGLNLAPTVHRLRDEGCLLRNRLVF